MPQLEYIATAHAGLRTHRSDLPVDDLSRLSALDPSQVQEWAAARIEEYTKRIGSLRTIVTTTLLPPSHNRKLSPEVLIEVFSQFPVVSGSYPHLYQNPLEVLEVCRYWRSLLFRTPATWAGVLAGRRKPRSPEREGAITRILLSLTGSGPLPLRLDHFHPSIVTTLLPHTCRFSTLEVHLDSSKSAVKALNHLLGADMPLLEDLSIYHNESPARTGDSVALKAERLPQLRKLHHPNSFI
ncbi:hypothetical protein C8T65DRAFT_743527 [Cerioporus squamosus]|nr:hypothetical protein C8T65DRAFT_743527 [Cerioporus squamosus]